MPLLSAYETAQPLSAAARDKKLFNACHLFSQSQHLKSQTSPARLQKQEWSSGFHQNARIARLRK